MVIFKHRILDGSGLLHRFIHTYILSAEATLGHGVGLHMIAVQIYITYDFCRQPLKINR